MSAIHSKLARRPVPKSGCRCVHPYDAQMPTDYTAWHDAAARRMKAGWKQQRCRCCGLFKVWVRPKRRRRAA